MIVFFWGILSAVIGVFVGLGVADNNYVIVAAICGLVAAIAFFLFGLVLAES